MLKIFGLYLHEAHTLISSLQQNYLYSTRSQKYLHYRVFGFSVAQKIFIEVMTLVPSYQRRKEVMVYSSGGLTHKRPFFR